ncbi:MAG: NUDIX hydrolase, partial [Candidatus Vogelbacteria bacterium]|nr:NUDIX hydrolase [Candidatus Vogelbacteria bacterium]
MNKKPRLWKTISSKVVFDHEHLKIVEDKTKLPNGLEKDYVRLAPMQPDSVIVIAINTKNMVLIQKEYSYPPNKIMWQLPGGSRKTGESIKAAAKRELAEESGYSAKNTQILGYFYTMNRLSDQKQYVVLCTKLFKHSLGEDEDEFIETFWLSKKDLTSKISNGEFDNINLLAA